VVTTELKPYERRQHELTIECGCLLWGNRVIVPYKLQSYVLGELHVSHPGIVRMKSREDYNSINKKGHLSPR